MHVRAMFQPSVNDARDGVRVTLSIMMLNRGLVTVRRRVQCEQLRG